MVRAQRTCLQRKTVDDFSISGTDTLAGYENFKILVHQAVSLFKNTHFVVKNPAFQREKRGPWLVANSNFLSHSGWAAGTLYATTLVTAVRSYFVLLRPASFSFIPTQTAKIKALWCNEVKVSAHSSIFPSPLPRNEQESS